jgi:hypothetical protein
MHAFDSFVTDVFVEGAIWLPGILTTNPANYKLRHRMFKLLTTSSDIISFAQANYRSVNNGVPPPLAVQRTEPAQLYDKCLPYSSLMPVRSSINGMPYTGCP